MGGRARRSNCTGARALKAAAWWWPPSNAHARTHMRTGHKSHVDGISEASHPLLQKRHAACGTRIRQVGGGEWWACQDALEAGAEGRVAGGRARGAKGEGESGENLNVVACSRVGRRHQVQAQTRPATCRRPPPTSPSSRVHAMGRRAPAAAASGGRNGSRPGREGRRRRPGVGRVAEHAALASSRANNHRYRTREREAAKAASQPSHCVADVVI